MATNADPRLIQLAESISDRAPVAWDAVRSTAGELAAVVDGLERVQELAEAFAASQAAAGPDRHSPPLARWGQLEILEPIGEGAFGEVYRARDPNLDREVALKLRRAGPGDIDNAGRRLLEEARRLARIRHPNVLAVHGADLCDGRVGIWTELVDGQTLEQRLEVDGLLGPGEAISIGLDLCRALAAVHAAGLVHGDVKAANVLRERGGRIVLTDLGSATEAGAAPITGSPATLAPEVLAGGPATAAADLYSLGVLLFQLLAGRFPVDADLPEAGRTTLRDLRPDLPPAVIEVVERAANLDPERRFRSAGALEQALAGTSQQPAQAADPSATADREAPRSPAGRRTARLAAWAAVAAMITVAAVAIWQWRPVMEPAPLDPAQVAGGQPVGDPDAGGVSTAAGPAQAIATTLSHAGEADDGSVAAEPAAGAASVSAPAAPAPRALEVRAALLRSTGEGVEELADGARLRPGDRLSLEIEAAEPVHVWVVNQDLDGNVFLLFPITGLDLKNPLEAGFSQRLPGRLNGVPQHWQVTSAGGRERFLVIASRGGLPEVERELAGMTAARPPSGDRHRGVGGIGPAALADSCRLDALAERLEADRRRNGSVWVMRLELVNP